VTKFAIPPTIAGYSVKPGPEVVATILDGGRPRLRKDILNASQRVNCSWILNREQYNYVMAFFGGVTVAGALPFTIDLVINTAAKATYTASFVPNSFQLNSKAGDNVYLVSAELDVEPVVRNGSADTALVAAYNTAHGVA
jgi:hypothetical protein